MNSKIVYAPQAAAAGKAGSSSKRHSYRLTIKRKPPRKQNHSGSAAPKRNCLEDIVPIIKGRLFFWGNMAYTANDDFPDVFSQKSVRNDFHAWLRSYLPEDEQLAISSRALAEFATKCPPITRLIPPTPYIGGFGH